MYGMLEDNVWNLVLFFHYLNPGDETHVNGQLLYLLSYLIGSLSFKEGFIYFLVCISILFAHISVHPVCEMPMRPEDGREFFETRVTDPCECWKLNLGPLQEQQVLLITEPYFHPLL